MGYDFEYFHAIIWDEDQRDVIRAHSKGNIAFIEPHGLRCIKPNFSTLYTENAPWAHQGFQDSGIDVGKTAITLTGLQSGVEDMTPGVIDEYTAEDSEKRQDHFKGITAVGRRTDGTEYPISEEFRKILLGQGLSPAYVKACVPNRKYGTARDNQHTTSELLIKEIHSSLEPSTPKTQPVKVMAVYTRSESGSRRRHNA
jgi:hypothetical protein